LTTFNVSLSITVTVLSFSFDTKIVPAVAGRLREAKAAHAKT
jgi:hypothetical protein